MAMLMIKSANYTIKHKEQQILECIMEVVAISVSYN